MSKNILIVDDKPEIAKVITIQLSKDYNVHSEGNPIEALAWMHSGNIPDLIISDVNMPEMDGRTFLKQLKASSTFNFIPVILFYPAWRAVTTELNCWRQEPLTSC